jgi:23S rRNA (adenine2503-C2)-methyltransferase
MTKPVEPVDLLSMEPEEWEAWIVEHGQPRYRGRQAFQGLWQGGIVDWSDLTVWPKRLREDLARTYPLNRPEVVRRQTASDGTTKLLVRLVDRRAVETVVLPHRYGLSVCVSSQVGCAMGCRFCASGLNGRVRQLTAGEMLEQVRLAQTIADRRITHVDVMGIGEPLDNYRNLVRFLRLVHHPWSFGLSYRHVTVSTSGLVPKILQLADEGWPITLAASLHAPNDALRSQLMPVNRAYPLRALIPACRAYAERTGRRVTYEYLLLAGVNDQDRHAQELVAWLRGSLCHVNVIPWNPVPEHPYAPSPAAQARRFQRLVQDAGISCTIRRELGQDIDAACGQLRLREEELPLPSGRTAGLTVDWSDPTTKTDF